jgi:hypothetical protein
MMWIIRSLTSGNYNSNKKCSQEEFDSIVKSHIFPEIYTVQQIENHGNKHWAHYAGLVESDER